MKVPYKTAQKAVKAAQDEAKAQHGRAEAAHTAWEVATMDRAFLQEENARLRSLVERAIHPIMLALNCPAHSWHGSDEARRWLIDAAVLGDQSEEARGK